MVTGIVEELSRSSTSVRAGGPPTRSSRPAPARSLTVAATHDDGFSVALIPHTLVATMLGVCRVGARVNLEVDLVAKYVERLLVSDRSPS